MGTAIRKAIYDWATAETGLPVIWANQNGPRPSFPYISLNVIDTVDVGMPYRTFVDPSDGTRQIETTDEFTVSIQLYNFAGQFPEDTVEALRKTLAKQSNRIDFHNAGFAFIDAEQAQDVSQALDSEMETRAAMNVMFRKVTQTQEDIGFIETVQIGATYYLAVGDLPILAFKEAFDDFLAIFDGEYFVLVGEDYPGGTPIINRDILVEA